MKLTNELGLPQPIVDAVRNDSYSRGGASISVTGLLRPPRISALEVLHQDALEEDASDRIWALFGQALHTVLERAEKDGIAERRLSVEVEGWKVSGQMDRYEDGLLQDYKFVTVYKFKDGEVPEEYEQQLNVYAEILRQNGHPVTKLQVVGILRDWSKLKAKQDESLPQRGVVVRTVELWPQEKAQAFLRNRVILHQQARVTLPLCSAEDRWAKAPTFALMKNGGKRAMKLYDNEADARQHASTDPKLLRVDVRPGESVRCAAYCPVAQFCTQYQQEQPASQAQADESEKTA